MLYSVELRRRYLNPYTYIRDAYPLGTGFGPLLYFLPYLTAIFKK